MKRKTVLLAVVAILIAGGAVVTILPSAYTAAPKAEPVVAIQLPPSIRVVPAARREVIERLDVTGTIVPREEAAVGFDLGGMIVQELNADQGDVVRKGDVLAVLDRSMLETQLAQFDANRAQAEASIAQVDAQITDAEIGVRQAAEALERASELQKRGVAAKAQFDNAVNAHDSAKAKLVSAQKALAASQAQLGVIDAQKRNLQVQVDRAQVKAPADGLVLSRNATLGGVVMAGGTPLFRIAIGGDVELAAEVPETALTRLETGMPVEIRLAGVQAPLSGSIRRIDSEVDQKLRMGKIRIAIQGQDHVRAGNFARGAIEMQRVDGIAVPASALVYRGADAFLQRVDSGGKVSTVPVTVGARDGAFVQISEGVAEGDLVVQRAGTFVADGDLVTPVREGQTGAAVR